MSNELLLGIPSGPFADNFRAIACTGQTCVFGIGSTITVVELSSMQIIATLTGEHSQTSNVTCLNCSQSKLSGAGSSAVCKTVIASGDTQGVVVTWTLQEGSVLNVLPRPRESIISSPKEMLREEGPQSVQAICWTGYDCKLLVALYGSGQVVIWDYLKGSVLWQTRLNQKEAPSHMVQSPLDRTCLCLTNDAGLLYFLRATDIAAGRVTQKEYKISASNSKFMRCRFGAKENLLHIVLEHTLLAFDSGYGVPVGSTALAQRHSPFKDILGISSDGASLFCVHQDGSISCWSLNHPKAIHSMTYIVPTLGLEGMARGTKLGHIFGYLKFDHFNGDAGRGKGKENFRVVLTTTNKSMGSYLCAYSIDPLEGEEGFGATLESMLRLLPPNSTSFCPQRTGSGGKIRLVAMGTQLGTLEIVDIGSGSIRRTFKVHDSAVLGVRWMNPDVLISFSSSKEGAVYNNCIVLTKIHTGSNMRVRDFASKDTAPLRGVRASSSGNYFALLFKNGLTELWKVGKDLIPTRIRVLNLPFTCIQFVDSVPQFVYKQRPGPDAAAAKPLIDLAEPGADGLAEPGTMNATAPRDLIVFSLTNGHMGAFEITGKKLRDLSKAFPFADVPTLDVITSMSCNDQDLVIGTSGGDIKVWSQHQDNCCSAVRVGESGPVRKIASDPCEISNDLVVLSSGSGFRKVDVDVMPLAVQLAEQCMSGTQILDMEWIRSGENGMRQYATYSKDGFFLYSSDQSRLTASQMGGAKHPLLGSNFAQRLAFYMQSKLPLHPQQKGSPKSPLDGDIYAKVTMEQFSEMQSIPDLNELELQQAYETYVKFVAELSSGAWAFGVPELVYYSEQKSGLSIAGAMDLAASVVGKTMEGEFWRSLPETLQNVFDGNYGGQGCLWDAAKQKVAAAESIYRHETQQETLDAGKSELRVLQYFVLGDKESAIAFLLAASPGDDDFYKHALRGLALASSASMPSPVPSPARCFDASVSPHENSLLRKAAKVLSAHCSSKDDFLTSVIILCLIGKEVEAVLQLQDVGLWEHAAVMIASYLRGDERREPLERWAYHVIYEQNNLWRGIGILVSAGSLLPAMEVLDQEHYALETFTLGSCIERAHASWVLASSSTEEDDKGIVGEEAFGKIMKRSVRHVAQTILQ